MSTTGLPREHHRRLEIEVVPERARVRLTRLLRQSCTGGEWSIIHMNRAINIAHTALELPIYVLDGGGWGEYHPAEYAWHFGELELVMRRPTTVQLAEIVVDLVKDGVIESGEVNRILEEENVSFRVHVPGANPRDAELLLLEADEIPAADVSGEHPNIRVLCERMDVLVAKGDAPGTLHAAACVFEALAKNVVGTPGVQNETLGSFFSRYRKDSLLPSGVLDYVIEVYNRRNSEPLAGHGHLSAPTISVEQAITLSEMTKAFVRIERQLAAVEVAEEVKRPAARRESGT